MNYEILKEIINLAESFEKQTKDKVWRKEKFVTWIVNEANKTDRVIGDQIPPQDGLIAMFLTIMSKYAQFYAKKVFRNTEVYSLEDFSVLVTLYPEKEFKKIDVLKYCILEKSSGNEVLKRLLRDNMLQERENPNDARSKLLSLTDKGKYQFELIQKGIENMSKHVTGDLSDEEKNQLLSILFKLHNFHQPYFEDNDESKMEFLR